jgi:hypothetical protein
MSGRIISAVDAFALRQCLGAFAPPGEPKRLPSVVYVRCNRTRLPRSKRD